MFIINEFLKDANQITIKNNKIIDEKGCERAPKIATIEELNAGAVCIYKNLKNNYIVESFAPTEKIKKALENFIQKEHYITRKNNAREQIIDILEQNRNRAMSWLEYAEQQALIFKIAKRCGLVKELHNEGII